MSRRVPFALLVLATLLVLPATVAAAGPEIQATVVPGREIDVAGSGFPASSDVTLVIQRKSHPDETRTLVADAPAPSPRPSIPVPVAAAPTRSWPPRRSSPRPPRSLRSRRRAEPVAASRVRPRQIPRRSGNPCDPAAAPFPVILVLVLAGALGAGLSSYRARQTAR